MKPPSTLPTVVTSDAGTANSPTGTALGFDLVSLCPIELNRDVFLVLTGEESLLSLTNSLLSGREGLPGLDLLERDLGDMPGVSRVNLKLDLHDKEGKCNFYCKEQTFPRRHYGVGRAY